jgi:hypothetical protein
MIRLGGVIICGNGECHGGEVESKNGFEEHHSARGRSKKLRFTEGCREGEPGQRRAERDTALYSRDPGRPFQEERERSDEVGYGEMSYFRWDEQCGVPLVCQSGS